MSTQAEKVTEETADRVALETETEQHLGRIFEEVLEVPKVELQDRFIKIGGNSLNLITVIKRIKEEMGVTLKSRLFFDPKGGTVLDLSQAIDAARDQSAAA